METAFPIASNSPPSNVQQGRVALPGGQAYVSGKVARALAVALGLMLPAVAPNAQNTWTYPDRVLAVVDPLPRRPMIGASYPDMYVPGMSSSGSFTEVFQDEAVQSGTSNPARKPCEEAGNPVVFSTGNKVETDLDFSSAGEMGLFFERTYNSRIGNEAGLLGHWAWITNFEYSLQTEDRACYPRAGQPECNIVNTWPSSESLIIQRPDGRQIRFRQDFTTGIYHSEKAAPVAKLVYHPAQIDQGDWVLHSEDGTIERYSAGGRIKEVKNLQGIGWTYEYGGLNGTQLQRVRHTSGRFVQFVWTGDHVTSVIDPAGNAYQYGYNAAGLLTTASLPGGTLIAYHYEVPSYPSVLTGKSYNGVRYSTFAYGSGAYMATLTEHAGGNDRYTFDYLQEPQNYPSDPDRRSTIVTNPLGKKATYKFVDFKLTEVIGHPSTNCPLSTMRSKTYDGWGYVDIVTDIDGGKTNFDYDAHGHLLTKVEAFETPSPRTTRYVWDESRNLIAGTSIDGIGRTDITFGANHRPERVVQTDASTGQARTTYYSYTNHPNGMVATVTVDGPLADDNVVTTYSEQGDLLEIANALGQRTTYSYYNALGLPARVQTASGAITDYGYDARGRVTLERTYPNGAAFDVNYVYGANGLLDAKFSTDGSEVVYGYDDVRRLIREDVKQPGGGYEVRRMMYNANSQPVRIEIGRDE